jgi:hypothetical protein
MGKASGSANRLLSRTVTVFAVTGQAGEHQGPGRRGIRTRASLATAHQLLWWRSGSRAALPATRFATLGEACSGHPEPRGT